MADTTYTYVSQVRSTYAVARRGGPDFRYARVSITHQGVQTGIPGHMQDQYARSDRNRATLTRPLKIRDSSPSATPPNPRLLPSNAIQCRLTAGIPTILLEQKVLGQPFSKDNSTSIVIHTTCTRTYTIHIYLNTYRETRSSGAGGAAARAEQRYAEGETSPPYVVVRSFT